MVLLHNIIEVLDGSHFSSFGKGCVAKTGGSLVKVVIVPTVSRPTDPVHEPKAPF
jgi:hypothetical protein